MALSCPDCKAPLQATVYEDVQVYFCGSCKGFFLSKYHLQQIVKVRDTLIPRNSRPPMRRATEINRTCPQCRIPMKKGKYGKLSATTFDLCGQCSHLWLDAGELDAIQLDYEMVTDNLAKSQKPSAPASPNPAPPPPAMQSAFMCPKCGHPQIKSDECARCGIIFAKYEAIQQERAGQLKEMTELTTRMDEIFSRLTGFEIHQQYHMVEALTGFERANRYELRPVPGASTRGNWQVEEFNKSGLSILGRNVLGPLYTFSMQVLDENRMRVLLLERRARFYFMHMDVFDETGRRIGNARRRFSWLNRIVSLHDDHGRELLRLTGPLHRPWTFLLRGFGRDVGKLEKRWTGVLKEAYTDADRFSLSFPPDMEPCCKRLVIGSAFLVDSLFYEGKRPFIGHFLGAPGIQLLAVIILVGALVLSTAF